MKPTKDQVVHERRGAALRRAVYRTSGSDDQFGQLREKLVRAIVKATTPGRQTQKQVLELERRAHKAFGDVCRRAAK